MAGTPVAELVVSGLELELEFQDPVESGKILLNFDPLGAQVDVVKDGVIYLSAVMPAAAVSTTNNRDEPVAGGGLPSPPVAGMVELDDGSVVPFIIGAVGDSPLEGSLPTAPAAGTQPKSLTYWYLQQ